MVTTVDRATPLVPPKPFAASLTAKFFRGLGDPTRVRIMELLLERQRSVSELTEATGVLQGRLSSHLACLRWCGFVTARRQGRLVYYRVADKRVRQLLAIAQRFLEEHSGSVEMCRVIDAEPGTEKGRTSLHPEEVGLDGRPLIERR